ncbi:MAG: OmpW family outer membrane protein [Betaproteobacteria bacterium]
MKSKFCFALSAITALTALTLGSAAQAQSQGSWLVRGGIMQLAPQVTSGTLSAPSLAGAQSGVSNSTQYAGGVTYMLSNSVAIDLPLALPFKHNLYGTGSIAGVGKIGDTKAIPATVMVQYRFGEASGMFRPYLGLGVTYAKFDGEHTTAVLSGLTGGTPLTPTTLSIQSKLAATMQVGASYKIDERWFVDGSFTKTPLKTRNTLSTGQTLDITLNPIGISLGVGMRY